MTQAGIRVTRALAHADALCDGSQRDGSIGSITYVSKYDVAIIVVSTNYPFYIMLRAGEREALLYVSLPHLRRAVR